MNCTGEGSNPINVQQHEISQNFSELVFSVFDVMRKYVEQFVSFAYVGKLALKNRMKYSNIWLNIRSCLQEKCIWKLVTHCLLWLLKQYVKITLHQTVLHEIVLKKSAATRSLYLEKLTISPFHFFRHCPFLGRAAVSHDIVHSKILLISWLIHPWFKL